MADLIDRKEAIRAWCLMTCGCKPDECGMTLEEDGTEECEFVEFLWNRPEYDYERNEDEYGRGKGMSDLISREAVIALAKDICVPIKDGTVYKHRCIDPDVIKDLPSECNVIYCRECKFYSGHRCQSTRGLDDWRNQDDYCSRAERIDQ